MEAKVTQKIVAAIKEQRKNYPSASKMAKALGLNAAQLSRLLRGETEGVVSEGKLINIARKLQVELNENGRWNVARTPVFEFIYNQLENVQDNSLSGLMCDIADIGKTFTAKVYVRNHKNAVYVDCSQVKTKQRLVRKIASEFGLDSTGRYADVYEDLIFYLKSIEKPLIILDEAGDLKYDAFLELKALWNATEGSVGWYMMGADGLKAKIERNLGLKKVGYAELFSRFGSRFQKVSPEGDALADFKRSQVAIVAQANGSKENIQKLYAKTGGSLRRLKIELTKNAK